MRRFEAYLDDWAGRQGTKCALIQGVRTLSYAEWCDAANRFAAALLNRGVMLGDRVVIHLDNSIEAAIAVFGTLKAGAVFSVVNPSTKQDKLSYILNNCSARCLVTHNRTLPAAVAAVANAASIETCIVVDGGDVPPDWIGFEPFLKPAAQSPAPLGISLDLAMIVYTSGSTGRPKGVMMTHDSIDAASWSITTYLENTSEDIILSALPLSFDYGLYQLLMACRVGATIVLENSFTYPVAVLETLQRTRATGFPLVPTMAALLLQLPKIAATCGTSLRYITNTAAALPPAHIEELKRLFPTAMLYSMYGITECKRCTYLPPEQLELRPGSVGIAIPGTEAFVLNERGERTAPGEVGTLFIRGRTLMKGYWGDAEATAKMLKPGKYPWEHVLCTGDLFKTDDEGFLYFVGRCDDIIKTRGEKVSPKEVENVLYSIPGVTEAAVVGVPDPVLGMALHAFLVVAQGTSLTSKDVRQFCAGRLESFMIPQVVEFRDSLPKTDTGKIRRRELELELAANS
jgi:amino acid adenylation domain-containing protein